MKRLPWIVWLVLALLPLRGWAVASMAMPTLSAGPAPSTVAEAQAAVTLVDRVAPPCHHVDQTDEAAATSTGDAPAPATGSTCQACDWCHAALGLAPEVSVWPPTPPAGMPPAAVVRDTGRAAVAGLDRPPRSRIDR